VRKRAGKQRAGNSTKSMVHRRDTETQRKPGKSTQSRKAGMPPHHSAVDAEEAESAEKTGDGRFGESRARARLAIKRSNAEMPSRREKPGRAHSRVRQGCLGAIPRWTQRRQRARRKPGTEDSANRGRGRPARHKALERRDAKSPRKTGKSSQARKAGMPRRHSAVDAEEAESAGEKPGEHRAHGSPADYPKPASRRNRADSSGGVGLI
jgi:hypothetical protein